MSFICENCGRPSPPKVKPISVVVQTRRKEYLNFSSEGVPIRSKGEEIVKEMKVCKPCWEGEREKETPVMEAGE